MQIKEYKQVMLVCKIFGAIGTIMLLIGSYLVPKLYNSDPSLYTCRVNGVRVDCPEHIGALIGAIPLFIGVIFIVVTFILYIKYRDKKVD